MSASAGLVALSLLLGAYAPQQAGSEPLAPAQEARAQALGKQLRCAVCQGLSITDSPASMARAQMDKVRALVTEGKTDAEIRDYFVARYGEWALLAPPPHGFNWFVWLGPLALLVVGAGFIVRAVRARPATPPRAAMATAAGGPAEASPAPGEDAYRSAIRSEVES